MEASALHAPLPLTRFGAPLLKLRSDEQLVALFRSGSEEAFAVIHDRYKQRLFAYCRQMLHGPRQDAEDVLQDVFVRAYSALRNDEREVNLRAWLYRVAHNRCIDQLRRPAPPEREIFEVSRTPLHDPIIEAQRREDLRKLVSDVAALPEQQRSALLMREIDGMSYADLADALGVTVPAVKSLLVRARVGLAEAAEARDLDCATIREDLALACDRGVRMSGRARKHLRDCSGCRDYKVALRGVKTSFAAIAPAAGLGPLALLAKLGVGGGATGGGAAAIGGGLAVGGMTAGKIAAVVAAAAVATGGAVEVRQVVVDGKPSRAATGGGGAGGGGAARGAATELTDAAAGITAAAGVAAAPEVLGTQLAPRESAGREPRRSTARKPEPAAPAAAGAVAGEPGAEPSAPENRDDLPVAPVPSGVEEPTGAPGGDGSSSGGVRGGTAAGGSGSGSGGSSTSGSAGSGTTSGSGAVEPTAPTGAPPGEAPPTGGTSSAPAGGSAEPAP